MPNMWTWLSGGESMDIARCQFCDIKFGHRVTEALDSFDYEIHGARKESNRKKSNRKESNSGQVGKKVTGKKVTVGKWEKKKQEKR